MNRTDFHTAVASAVNSYYAILGETAPPTLARYLSDTLFDKFDLQEDWDVIEFTWNGARIKGRVKSHIGGRIEIAGLDDAYSIFSTIAHLKTCDVSEARLASILDRLDGIA